MCVVEENLRVWKKVENSIYSERVYELRGIIHVVVVSVRGGGLSHCNTCDRRADFVFRYDVGIFTSCFDERTVCFRPRHANNTSGEWLGRILFVARRTALRHSTVGGDPNVKNGRQQCINNYDINKYDDVKRSWESVASTEMEIVELRDAGTLLPTTCVRCVGNTGGASVRNVVARRAPGARVGYRVVWGRR